LDGQIQKTFQQKNEFQSDLKGSRSTSEPDIEGDMFLAKFTNSGEQVWSSYFGSSDVDFAEVLLDSEDNIILRGNDHFGDITDSILNGWELAGSLDPYIVKINQDGELVFSLYYGGLRGDWSWYTVIDSQDNIITLGGTISNNFPLVDPIQAERAGGNDLFITKFDPNGVMLWSTYFGGTGNDATSSTYGIGDETGVWDSPQIRLDHDDNIIFFTNTVSSDISSNHPIVLDQSFVGATPFVGKIDPDGTLVYGSYFNGSKIDVLISETDNIFIAGNVVTPGWPITENAPQPQHGGNFDVTYSIIHANSTMIQSSYLGGNGLDELVKSYTISNGNYLILGKTDSTNLPNAVNPYNGEGDLFLCQIDSVGNNEWCRYIGGSLTENAIGGSVITGPNDEIFIVGTTTSSDFPVDENAPSSYTTAAFITKLDGQGDQEWSKIIIPESRPKIGSESDNTMKIIIASLAISMVILGFSYLRIISIKSKNAEQLLLNEKMTTILSPIFHNQPQLIHIFGATKIFKENKIRDEIQSELPKEILDFKYFLHPIRLSMVKLLDENIHLTTVQIKNFLGIGWNEVQFHLESLKKADYITINQQFIDGTTRTVVTAESKMISQFNSLKDILLEFLDATPNLDKYLEHVTEVKMRSEGQDLYPDNQ